MLGHGKFDWDNNYALQTIKDNVSLFTPEILDKLNQIFVTYGHKIVGKKQDDVAHAYDELPMEVFKNGVLSGKIKRLMAVVGALVHGCGACILF